MPTPEAEKGKDKDKAEEAEKPKTDDKNKPKTEEKSQAASPRFISTHNQPGPFADKVLDKALEVLKAKLAEAEKAKAA